MKDNDLLQLRTTNSIFQGDIGKLQGENGRLFGELSGLNVVKSLLKEKEDENCKLKQELHEVKKGSPINVHKQCEALELQLRQQLKESEELSQATFDKLNQRIEELKDRLKKAEREEFESSSELSQSTLIPEDHRKKPMSHDDSDQVDQEMQVDQEKQAATDADADAVNRDKTKDMLSLVSNCGAPKNAVVGPVGDGKGNEVYGTNATRSNLKKQRLQPTVNEYNLFDGPLEQPGLYRSRWKDLQREADKVYINPQSAQQQVNLVNLKRKAKNTSLDRAASRQAKRDNGVPLTLEERRAEQEATIKEQFQSSNDVTLKTENWLKSLSQCQINADFEKLGDPICDAIILPEVSLIFGTGEDRFAKMRVFLLDFKVPVKYVGKAVRDGCVFIQLQDHDNTFTVELLEKLGTALDALRKNMRAALKKQKKTKEECIEEEVENIYIKQIDYTQDLIGFFMSLTPNIFDDLRELAKLLNIQYSRDYTQLRTSFQFEKKCLLDLGKLATRNRLKIYNKLVHLWTSGQFKKWLNMNVHKIFNADQAFYFDKILPGMIEGLSRIEHSLYFYNKADQDETLFDVKKNFTKKLIDPVISALNKMKGTFRYKVPFPMFVNTYFRAAATKSVLLSFQANLWAIAFSHSERSYCFTGHKVNRTKNSGTMLDFIKRFVPDNSNMRIFIGDNMYDNIQKRGALMQLPISSLNEVHSEQYNLKLDSHFKYALSRQDLDTIQIISDDIELLQMLGIERSAQLSKRELKTKEKEEQRNKGILVEHLLEQKRDESKRYYVYKASSEKTCKFYPKDARGRIYQCIEHRSEQLQRKGKGKGELHLSSV